MNTTLRAFVLAGVFALFFAPAAFAFDVTFEANATSLTIVDDGPGDLNTIDPGVIDFDLTAAPLGGVLSGSGRVVGGSGPIGASARLGGPPAGLGILQNVDVVAQTITVTINGAPISFGPPLGWIATYDADFDDPTLGPVSSPTGDVTLEINPSTVLTSLAVVTQSPIAAPTAFYNSAAGSDPTLSALESRLTYTVELGPDDRIVLDDLASGSAIDGYVFNQDYRCIDRMNKASAKLADTAAKIDVRCIGLQAKLGGGDATPCVDDPIEPKTNHAETKQLANYAANCPALPAWGVNGASCCEDGVNEGASCTVPPDCPGGACTEGACMTHAAEYAAFDLAHEVFGAGVIVSPTGGKCQSYILKSAAKALTVRWKEFRGCKRTQIAAIPDDPALVSTCLGPPQPDSNVKIARADAKLAASAVKCVASGFTPLGALFGGACTAVPDALFPGCVAQRIQCAFCRAINVADDIVPPLDCDLFDDAVTNASCP